MLVKLTRSFSFKEGGSVIKVRSLDTAVERDLRSRGTGSVCELSEFKRTLENLAKEYCNYTFVVPKHCYS